MSIKPMRKFISVADSFSERSVDNQLDEGALNECVLLDINYFKA